MMKFRLVYVKFIKLLVRLSKSLAYRRVKFFGLLILYQHQLQLRCIGEQSCELRLFGLSVPFNVKPLLTEIQLFDSPD